MSNLKTFCPPHTRLITCSDSFDLTISCLVFVFTDYEYSLNNNYAFRISRSTVTVTVTITTSSENEALEFTVYKYDPNSEVQAADLEISPTSAMVGYPGGGITITG